MIGNDIIDWNAASERIREAKFQQKIFTPVEQAFIETQKDPFKWGWACWALKESAYKLAYRLGACERKFTPKSFECQLEAYVFQDEIAISGPRNIYKGFLSSTKNWLHAFCVMESRPEYMIEWQQVKLTRSNYTEQGREVRDSLIEAYKSRVKTPVLDPRVRKTSNGIPALWDQGNKLDIYVSLSHHGNYGAFALLETNAHVHQDHKSYYSNPASNHNFNP